MAVTLNGLNDSNEWNTNVPAALAFVGPVSHLHVLVVAYAKLLGDTYQTGMSKIRFPLSQVLSLSLSLTPSPSPSLFPCRGRSQDLNNFTN